jgi:uncharacterized membrane protein
MPTHHVDSPEVQRIEQEIEQEVETVINQDRVVSFSDAVFAFAATLLVLKIDLPNLDAGSVATSLPSALLQLWPTYFANIVSFLVIGYYWMSHHALFGLLKKFDVTIVWLNIIFLVCVSFLPFPVDLFGSFSTVPVVVMFYAACLALTGFWMVFMWWYAAWPGKLVGSQMSERRKRYYFVRNLIAPVVFSLSIPIAYVDHTLARVSWLLLLLGVIVVHRAYKYKHLSAIEKTLA